MNTVPELPRLPISVVVDPPQELHHSSYAIKGLADLLERGLIQNLSVSPRAPLHRGEVYVTASGDRRRVDARARKTTFLTLKSADEQATIAIDFRDAAYIFPEDGLLKCDVVFKRNFDESYVRHVSGTHALVLPAGLSFSTRDPDFQRARRRGLFWATQLRDGFHHVDRKTVHRLREAWRDGRHQELKARNRTAAVGGPRPKLPEHDFVFYQTRTFNREDDPDANEVHQQRAELIRALKAAFGPRFVGGFIHEELAARLYKDCLSNVPSDQSSYQMTIREAAVVVSSRGLVKSPPWKLAEFLAAGKCIVSENLSAELPEPLRPADHWLTFSTSAECVTQCQRALDDDSLRRHIAENAANYYTSHVEPASAMHRLLTQSLPERLQPHPRG